MTHSFIGLTLALIIIGILAYDRIRYGKAVSQGSTKANTLYAIEQANSREYRTMRLYDAVIRDILDKE